MSIYETAALSLITGILGSGKTLRAVQMMMQAIEKGEKVYQSGFKDLRVSGVIDWDDPKEWQQLPAGALLFVDEAQKWFGERRAGYAPAYLKAMNTMRGNEGVRMVLLTQHPKYLDPYVKDLVGCHEHLLRESGKLSSKLFRSDEIMEDPRSPRGRAKADTETFKFPIDTAGKAYTSADSGHTIKYRMPALVKKAILIGGGGALLMGGAWFFLFRGAYADVRDAKAKAGVARPLTAGALPGRQPSQVGERFTPRTGEDYVQALVPAVSDVMWTAPGFMQREFKSDPHLYCMSTADSCRCVTEQGTQPVAPIRVDVCRDIARYGEPYNPYKPPEAERQVQSQEQPRAAGQAQTVAQVVPRGSPATKAFPETPDYPCETCGR